MMDRLKKALSVILIALLLLSLAGCTGTGDAKPATNGEVTNSTNSTQDLTLVDMTGREVHLDAPAKRVVALTASDCEIVFALGAGNTVVGRGEYCDWPAEALSITAVTSGAETNIEEIIALEPDLVLMTTMAQTADQVTQLEDAGCAVYVSNATDISGTYTSISQIGMLLGKNSEASTIINDMKTTFTELEKSKLNGSIYFEVSPLEYGLWTSGGGTFMDEIAMLIGLENCFADTQDWAEVSEEQVIARNPDYILTIDFAAQDPTPAQKIMQRPGWENIAAVKNGHILNLDDNSLSRPGPRLAKGAQALYDFVAARQS